METFYWLLKKKIMGFNCSVVLYHLLFLPNHSKKRNFKAEISKGKIKVCRLCGFCVRRCGFGSEGRDPRGARSSRLRCALPATGGRRSTREAPGMRERGREWKRRITERGGPKATLPPGATSEWQLALLPLTPELRNACWEIFFLCWSSTVEFLSQWGTKVDADDGKKNSQILVSLCTPPPLKKKLFYLSVH